MINNNWPQDDVLPISLPPTILSPAIKKEDVPPCKGSPRGFHSENMESQTNKAVVSLLNAPFY